MSDHVLFVLRFFCLVAHVGCPLLRSFVVCHFVLEACRILFWGSSVYRFGAIFSCIGLQVIEFAMYIFRGIDRTSALAVFLGCVAGNHSFYLDMLCCSGLRGPFFCALGF